MPGNPLVRFDEGRVGRTARCRFLSYSTVRSSFSVPSSQNNLSPRRQESPRKPRLPPRARRLVAEASATDRFDAEWGSV